MHLQYVPVVATLVIAALIPALFLVINALLGPNRPTEVKGEAFECGNPSSGPAWGRFAVKFYLPAILFVVFDVEVVFMYRWAGLDGRVGFFGFVEMGGVMLLGGVGRMWLGRKGAV